MAPAGLTAPPGSGRPTSGLVTRLPKGGTFCTGRGPCGGSRRPSGDGHRYFFKRAASLSAVLNCSNFRSMNAANTPKNDMRKGIYVLSILTFLLKFTQHHHLVLPIASVGFRSPKTQSRAGAGQRLKGRPLWFPPREGWRHMGQRGRGGLRAGARMPTAPWAGLPLPATPPASGARRELK